MRDHRWYLPSLPLTVVNVTKTVSFILMLAAVANILILKVAFKVEFIQLILAALSVFVAVGMGMYVYRSNKVTVFNIYVSLMSAWMWITQIVEVVTRPEMAVYSKMRQTGFFLAFALLSTFLYYIQRIVRESRLMSFIDHVEVPIDGA